MRRQTPCRTEISRGKAGEKPVPKLMFGHRNPACALVKKPFHSGTAKRQGMLSGEKGSVNCNLQEMIIPLAHPAEFEPEIVS